MNYFDQFHLDDHEEPDRTETNIIRNDNFGPASSKFFSEPLPKPQSQIKEQRASDKWKNKQRMLFFKFYLKFMVKHPYLQISWKRWKVNYIFSLMAEYIKTKTKDQIKSFDERMKNFWFKKNHKDIVECLYLELKEYSDDDDEIVQLFSQLENKKSNESQHMKFLKNDLRTVLQLEKQISLLYCNWDFDDNI